MMNSIEYFLSTPSGRIHCLELGEGPPLLLLHSNGCSAHEYDQALPFLAGHFRCIAWDLLGHGDSEPVQGHISIDTYAAITVEVLDALGLERAHICGASVGGFVAMAVGRRWPERVSTLTIVESAMRTPEEWAAQWPRIEGMFAIAQQSHDEVAPRLRQLTPPLLTRWNIDRAKAGGWRMVDVMWAIREYDALGELARLRAPCAIVLGDQGPVIAGKPRYEQGLPAAPIRLIAQAGHFPMIDAPQEFARAILEGITELSGAVATA
ncbi:MAG TPA: alpha/beta fold hydrolase [Ramlibacter sp.]|nr:alpha/beta fold hydrolase [Ramlibacter sp.]